MRFDKEQRDAARAAGLAFISVEYDGTTLPSGKLPGIQFSGPVPEAKADQVRDLVLELIRTHGEDGFVQAVYSKPQHAPDWAGKGGPLEGTPLEKRPARPRRKK